MITKIAVISNVVVGILNVLMGRIDWAILNFVVAVFVIATAIYFELDK